MKFHENRSKGSGDMERTRTCYGPTDGHTVTDGLTAEGHSYNPLPLRGGDFKEQNKIKNKNEKSFLKE